MHPIRVTRTLDFGTPCEYFSFALIGRKNRRLKCSWNSYLAGVQLAVSHYNKLWPKLMLVVKSNQIYISKEGRLTLPVHHQDTVDKQEYKTKCSLHAPKCQRNSRNTEGMPGVDPSVLSAQVLQHLCRCALKHGFHKRLWGHSGILTYINQPESFYDLLARMPRSTNHRTGRIKTILFSNRHSCSSHHNLHKNTYCPHKRNCPVFAVGNIYQRLLNVILSSNWVVFWH